MRAVNEASPVEYREIDLLVVIAKTARIARFIRSSTAVKISAKVNWYWCFNLLNPFWWCRSCVARKEKDDDDNSPDAARPGIQGRNASMPLMRRSSGWGIVGLGAVAAARAKKEEEEENKAHPFLRLLRNMGILNNKDRELKRQVAALKIQRAWRIVLAQRYLDDEGEGYETGGDNSNHDLNWRGRSSASISTRGQSPGPLSRSNNFNNLVPIRRVDPRLPTNEIRKRKESQVGSAMRELTGQRVAIGILVALVVTVLFTYTENDATRPATMIVLHAQTRNPNYAQRSLDAARASSIPDLFSYQYANGTIQEFLVGDTPDQELRPREILRISVEDSTGLIKTVGLFAYRSELKQEALVHLLSSIFIILIWFFGVTGFAGPVMILVVIPIERMVSLLEMLMRDPLGYQNSARYKKFLSEEKEITKNTRWTKEVLKGMETSFLMHTILRIGSLMKVGFGSAGVEIIRNNLEGKNKSMLTLSGKGSTVSCIFLFCDIRQFTDATECLQEEVFVFTNKIAAVVHSICNSYGGSANKNIGDAFLLSWRLDDEAEDDRGPFRTKSSGFQAKSNQADKALLSVVKICMALHYDDYYLETMSDAAREALLAKLSKRKGPVVQLGFGLHAGKAVQGSIGSQRKIDATYVSEAVERAEFLESSTKQYGVKMLMSHDFHRLLHPNNRRRCRKIDQILIKNDDDDGDEDYINGDTMDLYTFDMDIDALWRRTALTTSNRMKMEIESDSGESNEKAVSKRDLRTPASTRQMLGRRRPSVRHNNLLVDESSEIGIGGGPSNSQGDLIGDQEVGMPAKLVLPTGPALYNAKVWVDRNMHEIRRAYTDGIFLQKFNAGLQSFYSKDWERAKQCFTTCMEKIEDGPSRYFLDQIEKHDGKPPRNFLGYGIA
jgi:class 3 adenylate cyclase